MPRKWYRHNKESAGNFGHLQAVVTDEEGLLDYSFHGVWDCKSHVVSKTSEFSLMNLETQEKWSLLAKKK